MTIYPFRGPLVRPSTESAQLEERRREEEDEQGGDEGEGEESDETQADCFAHDGDRSQKLKKAIGGRPIVVLPGAGPKGKSVLAIRTSKG